MNEQNSPLIKKQDMENNEIEKHLGHLKEDIRKEEQLLNDEKREIELLEKELEHRDQRFCISVNAEEKEVEHKEICYKKVVELAFGCLLEDGVKSYTVTYKKGPAENPEGSMINKQCVKIKDGMRFNVTQTNKS
jgi:DNA gyrase/topoisomerase IV subunit A